MDEKALEPSSKSNNDRNDAPELTAETGRMFKYGQFENEDVSVSAPGGDQAATLSIDIQDTQISTSSSLHVGFKNGKDELNIKSTSQPLNASSTKFMPDPAGCKASTPKSTLEAMQLRVQRVVQHIVFRIFTLILILTDFILVIVDLSIYECDTNNGLEITSHIIITYFMLEVGARIFYKGRRFFYNWIDIVDMVVVVASFFTDMIFASIYGINSCGKIMKKDHHSYVKLLVAGRVVRIFRILRILYFMYIQHRHLTSASRKIVSQNKRRYQRDGFDLDLCYITERVIAMSFPSTGLMAFYRNPIHEVVRFFETKHKNHYKIYNLCSERDYDESLFHNRVERICIDDHNVPSLKKMVEFCSDVREWMAADKNNIIAVHCKGGKGRTGTIICVWLIDCGLFQEAKDVLEYFGDRRTDLSVGKMFQGVQTPSQSRYVGYFEKMKQDYNGKLPEKKELNLISIKITAIKGVGNGDGSDLSIEIRTAENLIYECHLGASINCQVIKYTDSDSIMINLHQCPVLVNDIKVKFNSTNKKLPKGYDNCPFYFWFHTSFIEDHSLYLSRDEIDNPHKPKLWNIYRENFAIIASFEDVKD
ncbi:phosphatidylinositol 3,4,5-trisphosphate 3-phosphatase TPTE2-like isoform X1 [Octopus sinensis]|uniref:Phosphatidylinositol 3,4,5-trisphosphate 3-phosphatase TPTE2-like isoform X1 n=2 Tax=Octopus sinensis TaxID=2607531 RepID=A0A7E6EZ06_9MOLL|nr:phosphatidylinositol 3,4,5-trisphosphate 3-phosphatase TPTE2-like isoform X1 [Octopus sinensis]